MFSRLRLLLAPFLLCTLAVAQSSPVNYAVEQWRGDSSLRVEDAYKWLFQATMGGEHAAPDEHSAREWMENEWKTLGPPESGEALWVPLDPEEKIGRLNLRPYRARGGKIDDALAAFLSSARSFRGKVADFRAVWMELGQSLKRASVHELTWAEWQRLDNEMRPKQYPAVHHSNTYQESHRPAYRILTASEAQKLIAKLPPA